MATGTGGTAAATSLVSLIVSANMVPADVATIANGIWDDRGSVWPNPPALPAVAIPAAAQPYPGAFGTNGLLYVPNRGVLKVFPGDIVMYDANAGWPVLVSKLSAQLGAWVHAP